MISCMSRTSSPAARAVGRALKLGRSIVHNPRVSTFSADNLIRLGTDYGGWVLQDSPDLYGCTIISAGLGEDASFDVEFATRFGACVLIVDPTPRAIVHYERMIERLGQEAETAYTDNGHIPAQAYDLSMLSRGQLQLVERALTDEPGPVRFFAPPNPAHVSHSIVNFQNDYSSNTPYLLVDAITIGELWEKAGGDVPLVKLDIEGAEIEAILDMLSRGLLPRQLLVEFDELNFPSRRATKRFRQVHGLLLECGFRPAYREGRANFLYLKRK